MNFNKKIIYKDILITTLLFIPLYVLFYFFQHQAAQQEKIDLPDIQALDLAEIEQKSAIGVKENIEARIAYETRMLVDPKSGTIPRGIRSRERYFAENIPARGGSKRNARQKKTYEISKTEWTANGPFFLGGRTRALALDVTDENIIIAGGTSGGMWRSTDAGSTWDKVTRAEALHSVTAVAQDIRPGKEDIWYYGTGELSGNSARGGGGATYRGDGIFKSTNGGLDWTLLPSTSQGEPNNFTNPFQFVWNVITNPHNNDEDEVLAATFGGIQRSTDGGNSWEYVIGEATNASSLFTDVAQGEDGTFYATLSESAASSDETSESKGIYRSEDGQNWTKITPRNFPDIFDRAVIGISPSNPNVVYFLVSSNPNDLWRYTYLFGDGSGFGGRWVDLTDNIPMFGGPVGNYNSQGSYNMMVKIHPENEDIVFLGGTNLYRSTDGFSTTTNTSWIGGYSPVNDISNYPGQHPDQHNMLFLPSNSDVSITSHDGGISITNDILAPQVNWTSLNNGYITTQFYTLAINEPAGDNTIVGGMQDNGSHLTFSADPRGEWSRLLGGDGGFAAIGHNGANVYLSSQNGRTIRFFLSGEGLIPVARIDPALAGKAENQRLLFINPFILDPGNNSRMYYAGGDRIWRNGNVTQISGTTDSTTINWFDLPDTRVLTGQITSLAISRTPGNILFYGTSAGSVFKVSNPDTYAPQIDNVTSSSFPDNAYVSCIDIDPSNADNILIVFSNYNVQSMYLSQNGGLTYEPVSGNLEERRDGTGGGPSVRWAKIIPKTNNAYLYLAGTSTGLYSADNLDGMNTAWAQEGPDIIGNVVVPMVQYRHADGWVAVATHGNGVYTKTFDNVLPLPSETTDEVFSLAQNFPNPFSDFTTIRFTLPQQSTARIRIFDSQGKRVRTILLTTQFEGENEVIWDGKDGNGVDMRAGIYYYKLDYGVNTFTDESITRKLILIR